MIAILPDNGLEQAEDGHRDLTFADTSKWGQIRGGGQLFISFGDPDRGPAMSLSSLAELTKDISFPAHKHYADTFRITIRGSQFVGAEAYAAGEFRLHQASKPYGGDGAHAHEDGHWTFVMFGDRRGGRMVPTNRKDPWWSKLGEVPEERLPSDPPGVAGLATSFGQPKKNGRMDGSYLDRSGWTSFEGRDVAAVYLGDIEVGPINVCIEAAAGVIALNAAAYGCDVIFVVIRGTLTCGGRTYVAGDLRLQEPEFEHPVMVAGNDGVSLLVICGDRRGVVGTGSDLASVIPTVDLPALV